MHATKVIVAALFISFEECFAQVAAFETFVDGLCTEPSGAHGRRDAASGKRVRVVRGIAHEGKTVKRVILERTGNGDEPADGMVDLCAREKLLEPFHRDFEDVPVVLAACEESGTEVRDVRLLFRETPDVAVVDKVVTLPEGEVVGLR